LALTCIRENSGMTLPKIYEIDIRRCGILLRL
jgi:hypothetical protein